MSEQRSRRDFLRTAALTGAGVWMADKAWAVDKTAQGKIIGANDKINFACIGVGGKGDSDSNEAAKYGNIVAICDVDDNTLDSAAKKWPNAKKYNDYRQMFAEMGKDIDAVTVSTPDHHHVHATAMALHLGKHAFCQKPLTHSIYEARYIGDLARKMGVATQMGNQGTASSSLRSNAYKVRAGALGNVTEVHVWTNRPIWPQGGPRPAPEAVPSNLHWDLWLGPAPDRPFVQGSGRKPGYHTFAWRGWWDFGTGALGDMACHTVNLPFMALDLRYPTSVVATSSGNNKDSYPKASKIIFEFPAIKNERVSRGPITLYWYDGSNLPPAGLVTDGKFALTELVNNNRLSDSGSLIVGDKGVMYTPNDYGSGGHIVGGVEVGEVSFPRAENDDHFLEFVKGIRGEGTPTSNFPDYAVPLTETILLGNLAVWSEGKKIEWDAKKLRAKNAPEVASIIRPSYRSGYALPKV